MYIRTQRALAVGVSDDYIRNDLKDIPFDKALPFLQNKLWEIADKHGTTGDKVFGALMDNWKDF